MCECGIMERMIQALDDFDNGKITMFEMNQVQSEFGLASQELVKKTERLQERMKLIQLDGRRIRSINDEDVNL